jgi:hypothetical protein
MPALLLLTVLIGPYTLAAWYETAMIVRGVGMQASPVDLRGPYWSLNECAKQQRIDQDAEAKTRSGLLAPNNPDIIYSCEARVETP